MSVNRERQCPACRAFKLLTKTHWHFGKNGKRSYAYCRECYNRRQRINSRNKGITKQCPGCEQHLPVNVTHWYFSKDEELPLSHCIQCNSKSCKQRAWGRQFNEKTHKKCSECKGIFERSSDNWCIYKNGTFMRRCKTCHLKLTARGVIYAEDSENDACDSRPEALAG